MNTGSFQDSPESDGNRVKVRFELIQDADGYPPATSEDLWAVELRGERFQIDNIPFFVNGVSYQDIVSATKNDEGVLCFEALLEEGGHSTVRVILLNAEAGAVPIESRSKELRAALRERGCSTEQSHIRGLISADIPPEADFKNVRSFLQKGSEDGRWDYEEATIAHGQS